MKKKIVYILIVLMIGSYLYNHFFTKKILIGKYYNVNYGISSGIDASIKPDVLILYENKFKSKYYGEGTYNLIYSLKGTSIELKPNIIKLGGFSSYTYPITRGWYGNPKIILFYDIDHYYERDKG